MRTAPASGTPVRTTLLLLLLTAFFACGEEKAAQEVSLTDPLADDEMETITQALTLELFEQQANTDQAEFEGLVAGGAKLLVSQDAATSLAADEAVVDLPGIVSADSKPVFLKLLNDIQGKPSAWVAVYATDGGTAQQMLAGIKEGFIKREQGIKAKEVALIREGEAQMMQLGSFHTVIMGATPFSRRFIQSHAGVPRFLSMGLIAHKRAFRQLKVPPKAIHILGGRYDNRAGPGNGTSVLLEVTGPEQSDEAPMRYAFQLAPDDGFGGELSPVDEAVQAKAAFYADHPLTPELKDHWAKKWYVAAKAKGFSPDDKPWCIACEQAESLFQDEEGPVAVLDFATDIATSPLDDLFDTGDDGTETEPCANCSDFVAQCFVSELDPAGIVAPPDEESCTGYTWSFASTGFISGLPNLCQWRDNFFAATLDDGYASVGCGPIAATTILAWYDSLGFDNLVTNDSYSVHDSASYSGWQGVAVHLNDLMKTKEWGTAAYTPSGQFEDGFDDFLAERGYTGGLTEVDEPTDIIAEIVEGRPLILLYTVDGWHRDHYVPIVGYYNDPNDDDFYVHVNCGWGGYTTTGPGGESIVAGTIRYHWDELYEGVQDAIMWRVRIYSGDTEWNESAVNCAPLNPCSDLGFTGCADYATMPPNRTSDPKAVRPPNLPDATCSPERDLFDGTDCVVKFWGNCLSDTGTTFTCTEGDAGYAVDYFNSCL